MREKEAKSSFKISIFIALVIVIGLVVFRLVNLFAVEEEPISSKISVEVQKAKMMDLIVSTPISAKIKPNEEVNIFPTIMGKITNLYVQLGDKVEAGDLLFTIDQSQIITSLNQAKEAENVAKSTFDRITTLYEQGAVSFQEFEQSRLNFVNAQQAYIQVQSSYDNTLVKAPISGYITENNINVGLIPQQALPSMIIADTSKLLVETEVSESIAGILEEGDEVDVFVEAVSSEPQKGRVIFISQAPTNGKMTYNVKIELLEKSKVKAGMFAKIKIVNSKKTKVVSIPTQSIIIRDGEKMVAVLESKSPKFVKVQTGLDNGEYVEILNGIKEGDSVIVKGQQYVVEGEPVNVIEKENKENE